MLETLKADQLVSFIRYGSDHHYLGNPGFADTRGLLDTRRAVILLHHTHPVNIYPAKTSTSSSYDQSYK
jgi:hypothetical protein